jgi:hypothetical protein
LSISPKNEPKGGAKFLTALVSMSLWSIIKIATNLATTIGRSSATRMLTSLSIWNSLTGIALWNIPLTSRRKFEILISRPFRIWVLSIITCFWNWLTPMTKRQNWGETDQFDFLRGSDKMMSLIDLSIFLTV